MKVFAIPSWYPSEQNPSYGIFIKEQIAFLAKHRPEWDIGVSTWGQGRFDHELWGKDHLKNFSKVKRSWDFTSDTHKVDNLTTYYEPALSWTKKIYHGNLKGIIRANELNLQQYIMSNGKPDVLWVQASYPGAFIGSYLAKKYELPFIVHIRFGGFMFQNLLNDLGKMSNELLEAFKKASLITFTSKSQKESLKLECKSRVLPNPVDTTFFQQREIIGSGIVAIGRLEQEKGFDLLIEAIKEVPKVELAIVGDGSQKEKIIARTRELGLDGRINFIGQASRDEVKQRIQQASFLVLPSQFETFGNVLLEAMACGLPVVATRCGGPEEIVTAQNGILCDPTIESLGGAINQLINERGNYESVSIRQSIIDQYSVKAWVDQLEENFKAAIEG